MEHSRTAVRRIPAVSLLILLTGALCLACGVRGGGPEPEPVSRGAWTLASGSDASYQFGVYGALGVPAPENIPGARRWSTSWTDGQGNLWLFGGTGVFPSDSYTFGYDTGDFNDLWKFDPLTSQWTWFSGADRPDQEGRYGTQGLPAPDNVPGARFGAVSWTDSSGRLWLFGGRTFGRSLYPMRPAGTFNDLWMFDPATLEWTWISGSASLDQPGLYGTKGLPAPSNAPGSRTLAYAWLGPGDELWLFGGNGLDAAGDPWALNDLWRFDPETLEWTWISGGDSWNRMTAVYGTRGVPDPTNVPGGRSQGVSWLDTEGNFWLFGGDGHLNDVWKFDPAALEWTWISGSNFFDDRGVYGTMGLPAPMNVPRAREAAASWLDGSGNLWVYGGSGYDSATMTDQYYNDLWKYDPLDNEWTWVSGGDGLGEIGYRPGTPSEEISPGSIFGAVSWLGPGGKFWLFGGDRNYEREGLINGLWQYAR